MPIFQPLAAPTERSPHQRFLLLHNWRTAGSSTSSLLATNFGSAYLKVGLQYTEMGLPNGQAHQITTLDEVRAGSSRSLILGGHLFAGLPAFLPGDWQLWMTARNPVKRARSGVLRFHGRPYRGTKDADKNLFSHEGSQQLETEDDLRRLFQQHLRYERNGMCRRLAMLALAPSFRLAGSDNLEKVPELSADYRDEELYEAARSRLSSIRILILTEYYTSSTICLERWLGQGPLLNPFTDLRLNGRSDKHTLPEREQLLNRSDHILAETQASDLRLWKHLKKRFQQQLKQFQVTERDVAIRDAIQGEPLFNPMWFTKDNLLNQEKRLLKTMARSVAQRAQKHRDLAEPIIDQIASWQRLTPEASSQLVHFARKELARL